MLDTWKYKIKEENPMYTTTTNQYGYYKPTVHDMPLVFRGQSAKFSEVIFYIFFTFFLYKKNLIKIAFKFSGPLS